MSFPKIIFSFVFLFCLTQTYGTVKIYGDIGEYDADSININLITNFVVQHWDMEKSAFAIKENGKFELDFNNKNLNRVFIQIGELRGSIYIENGGEYELELIEHGVVLKKEDNSTINSLFEKLESKTKKINKKYRNAHWLRYKRGLKKYDILLESYQGKSDLISKLIEACIIKHKVSYLHFWHPSQKSPNELLTAFPQDFDAIEKYYLSNANQSHNPFYLEGLYNFLNWNYFFQGKERINLKNPDLALDIFKNIKQFDNTPLNDLSKLLAIKGTFSISMRIKKFPFCSEVHAEVLKIQNKELKAIGERFIRNCFP